jgi:hypothetical protein
MTVPRSRRDAFVTDRQAPSKRKPPPPRKKVETPEERRERGRRVRTSPLASKIDDSIRRRLRNQSE